MVNIELLLNPHIAPVYIGANNIIYMTTVIALNEMYVKLKLFAISVLTTIKILFSTFVFIINQLYKEIYNYFHNNPLTSEQIIFISAIMFLISLFALNKEIQRQNVKINSLQKQIYFLELARNDNNQVWSEEIKTFMKQTNIKYSTLDKRTKKIERKRAQGI